MGRRRKKGRREGSRGRRSRSLEIRRLGVVEGFPGGSDGRESSCNAEDLGSIPGLGRSPGGGHGNPLQYSCLENPHGQKNLEDYSPWRHRVRHNRATKHSTVMGENEFQLMRLREQEILIITETNMGFPGGASGKEPTCQCR